MASGILHKIFKKIIPVGSSIFVLSALSACHESPDYSNSMYGNFDALVDIIDTHYCFLDDKDIDWRELSSAYRNLITDETNYVDLFFICAALLDELQDGHVNLSSQFTTSYYRNWWTDYPQDFDLRTLQQYYLNFSWLTAGGMYYYMLPDDIGYIYYPSFSNTVGETALDYILLSLQKTRGLIIDIRDNGGGALTNIDKFVARFTNKKFIGGYIQHKTGPSHNDFSEPYPLEYSPASEYHVKYDGPIVILTNRSCFSAANSFVAVMKTLPQVTVIGATTGGGGGMPFSSELPIGWSIRFSACPILDAEKNLIENGIEPNEVYEVHASSEELAQGKDAILERAMDFLREKPLPEDSSEVSGER